MNAMNDMKDKVAIVTGGGSGIGRASALLLARRGATVVVADRDESSATKVVREIEAAGGRAMAQACEVTDDCQLEALVDHAVQRYGRLDYAMNNAGITGAIGPLVDYEMKEARRIIDINLVSLIASMQAELRVMVKQGFGSIVNTCSIWGVTAGANYVAYSASKHGVAGATKAAALEVATSGIRVNAICPGFTETPMVMEQGLKIQRGSAEHKAAGAGHPMDRMGQPHEMAEGAVWLFSDGASFVTGHLLMIDGGFVAR